MQTGDAQRGFTYLALLFALALGGAALAALGERWQTAAEREREAELLFRGGQIRDAIARYAAAGGGALPPSLEALLRDERVQPPRHWLRQLYADPFSGQPDWLLLRAPGGGVQGVASRSRRIALRRHALPVTLDAEAQAAQADGTPPRVGDWQFLPLAAGSDAATPVAAAEVTNKTRGDPVASRPPE